MSRVKLNKKTSFKVQQTVVKQFSDASEASPLGRRLMKIAKEIECSDGPPFDESAIEKELEKRRGAYQENGR